MGFINREQGIKSKKIKGSREHVPPWEGLIYLFTEDKNHGGWRNSPYSQWRSLKRAEGDVNGDPEDDV